MKKVVLIFLIQLQLYPCFLQENLVLNSSFEELSACPIGADIDKALGWFSPTEGTPDLFNACASLASNCSVPVNAAGFQEAFEGNGYAGIVTYSYNASPVSYREYLATDFIHPMEKNRVYKVSFYSCLSNSSPVASNQLSVGFAVNEPLVNNHVSLIPDAFIPNMSFVTDTVSWQKYESYYLAKGGEKTLFIGNFAIDAFTDTIYIQNSLAEVYYLIDDVSVIDFELAPENVFSPNGDFVNDLAFFNEKLDFLDVYIYNRWGNLINCVNMTNGWDGKTTNGYSVTEGVYYYVIVDNKFLKEAVKTGFIQVVH